MTLKLTLEAIQIVSTIAREGSFSAAAEILHKVPSTISYSVARLEEQLGVTLFRRNGPKVTLTPAGKPCWPRASGCCRRRATWNTGCNA